MCLEIKIFLLPIQVNFSFSRVFSNCCKVCSEDVTRAENSFAGLLYMNLRSVADCMHDRRVIKLQCVCFTYLSFKG